VNEPHNQVLVYSRDGTAPPMLDGLYTRATDSWYTLAETLIGLMDAHIVVAERHLTRRDLQAIKTLAARAGVRIWLLPAAMSARHAAAALQCGASVLHDADTLVAGPLRPASPMPQPPAMAPEPPPAPRPTAAERYDEAAVMPSLSDEEIRALLGANE